MRKRIFVWSHLESRKTGAMFAAEFANGFTGRLVEELRGCRAETLVHSETGLELDDGGFRKAIERFDPDTVLVVKKVSGRVGLEPGTGNEILQWAIFSVSMFGSPDRKQRIAQLMNRPGGADLPFVWKSVASFDADGRRGRHLERRAASFADDVTNQMKGDGLFPGCAPILAPEPKPKVDESA